MTDRNFDIDQMVIQSYLDGELEGADLAELERQLSESPELRAEIERAENEHSALRNLLQPPKAPERLRARLSDELDAEDRRGRQSRLRSVASWSLPATSIAAAAAALMLFMARSVPDAETDKPSVAHHAVRQRIRTQVPMPVVNPPSRNEVSASLTSYFSSPVSAPRFAATGVRFNAWRPSQIDGREAAELHYSASTLTGRHNVTLYVIDARDLDFGGASQVEIDGRTLWLDQPFGFSTVSYKDEQGIGYVFTSDMSEAELVELVTSSDILHRSSERLR